MQLVSITYCDVYMRLRYNPFPNLLERAQQRISETLLNTLSAPYTASHL